MSPVDTSKLPLRKIYKMNRYESLNNARAKMDALYGRSASVAQGFSLKENEKYLFDKKTVQTIKISDLQSEEEKPSYYYFLHERMDGILSAYQLKSILGDDSIMMDRSIFGESSINCIKQRKLLSIGLQQEIIQKKSFISTYQSAKLIAWFISTLLTIISLLLTVITASNGNQVLLHLFIIPKAIPIIAFIVFCIITCVLTISRLIECRRQMMEELKATLKDKSDTDFADLISNLTAEDYDIPGLKHKIGNELDIVCPLSMLSYREQIILSQYWYTNTSKEFWWIFLEDDFLKEPLILAESKNYHRRIYRILPLTSIEKRALASELGIRDKNDPGLRMFGVDYIGNTLLPCRFPPERETIADFQKRLKQFVELNQNRFPFDIIRVIRLVAELSVTFRVDFSASNWSEIFTYSSQDSLSVLDRKISSSLIIGNNNVNVKTLNELRLLVSLILSEFESNLYQVIKSNYGHAYALEDIQLYQIKALRWRGKKGGEHCLSIAESLSNVLGDAINTPDTFVLDNWDKIIEQALRQFRTYRFGWFSARLIHSLLELWDKNPSNSLKNLLKSDVVQISLKEQIYFFNQEDRINDPNGLDIINDHLRLLNVIQSTSPIITQPLPTWTDLLNLTESQKQQYVSSLLQTKEDTIPKYFQILYDIFNAEVCHNESVICRHLFPANKPTVKDSIGKLLNLVEELGNNQRYASSEGCKVLSRIMSDSIKAEDTTKDLTSQCLYYMALWDALGFSIGSFAASVVFQVARLNWSDNEGSNEKRHDLYINMGNPIARLVYLTCVQKRDGGFYSQQAIELTDALTIYKNPSNSIMGYILTLNMYSLPEQCRKKLDSYFLSKRSIIELCPQKGQIMSGDLIHYIRDVFACSVLNNDMKKTFLQVLIENYELNYGERKDSPVIKELLIRFIENRTTDRYQNSTPKEILSEAAILCSSPDIIYLLYCEIDKMCGEIENDELWMLVADQLTNTVFIGGILLLIRKWVQAIKALKGSIDPRLCSVAKTIFKRIYVEIFLRRMGHLGMLFREELIKSYYGFLEVFRTINCDFSMQTIDKMNTILSELEQQVMLVAIMDAVHSNRWSNESFPLLTCIYYILDHAIIERVTSHDHEFWDTQSERDDWLRLNINSLQPIITRQYDAVINQDFIDLLNMIIKHNDLQLAKIITPVIEAHITEIVNTVFTQKLMQEQIITLLDIVRQSYKNVVYNNR